jgi:hypothetical protein
LREKKLDPDKLVGLNDFHEAQLLGVGFIRDYFQFDEVDYDDSDPFVGEALLDHVPHFLFCNQ